MLIIRNVLNRYMNSKINTILIICLLITPIFNNLTIIGILNNPIFDYINEYIYISFFIFLIGRYTSKLKISKQSIFLFVISIYFIFQILLYNLPNTSFIQVVLYLQAPIYYIYFNELNSNTKIYTIQKISSALYILGILVISVAILELIFPNYITSLTHLQYTNRGLFGYFYLGSIYGSSISLAHFCIIILVFYFINRFYTNKIILSPVYLFFLSIILLFTFSRKESFIYIFLLFFSFHILTYKKIKIKSLIIPFVILTSLFFFYIITFFSEANFIALSEGYVRTEMLSLAYDIFIDYLPFGSGIGTFGSQMSLLNPMIYEKYNIGNHIIGYPGERGPIYDLFLPTFTAELGIGILIYIYFFIHILKKETIIKSTGLDFIKIFIVLIIIINGIFAPVLMTSFGLILISILGLITQE